MGISLVKSKLLFFYKFVSKMQFYSGEQNCNVIYLVDHLYLKSLSLDFILENSRNASWLLSLLIGKTFFSK